MSTLDDAISELDTVLTTKHGPAVLKDVHDRDDDVVSLDELVASLHAKGEFDGRNRLAVRLHHVTLPKLEESGAIEYDAADHLVESRDGELVSLVVDLLQEN